MAIGEFTVTSVSSPEAQVYVGLQRGDLEPKSQIFHVQMQRFMSFYN